VDTEQGRRRSNPRGQGALLRDEIIDAASALVAQTGADGLSLRSVARRVGVAATSIYLHFSDVQQLKVAVVEVGFVRLDEYRDRASDGVTDPVEFLLARCRAYCRFALDHPGHYRLMFGPGLPDSLAYGAGATPGRRAIEQLAVSIARCPRAKPAAERAEPLRLALAVWTMLHGIASLRIDRPSFPWPADLNETVDDAVLRLTGVARARSGPARH